MTTSELIVVMPVYNEQANIREVLTEWLQTFRALKIAFVFVAVNDGSKDKTLSILQEFQAGSAPELQIIDKPNSGHGRSCRVGYEAALQQEASWIFQIDSDGQCDPRYFQKLWNARANADCVFGDRRTRDDGSIRVFVSFCCRLLLWGVGGAYVHDPNVPYRLIRAEALRNSLKRIPPELDLQNVLLALALKKNRVRWHVIPIHFRARRSGSSTNLQRIVTMGLEMLTDVKHVR